MYSGYIDLMDKKLLEFIKEHKFPPAPGDAHMEKYRKIYKDLTENVPEDHGWYAWIKEPSDSYQILYIGRTEIKDPKSSGLKARIRKWLDKANRGNLWTRFMDVNLVKADMIKKQPKYKKEIESVIRQESYTHIIWISKQGLTKPEIENVEGYLIAQCKELTPKLRNIQQPNFDEEYLSLAEKVKKELLDRIYILRNTLIQN